MARGTLIVRPDSGRARRVLAVAGLAIAAAELTTGLALDTAPPRVRFPEAAEVLEKARALGGEPYLLLLGSSRFWELDMSAIAATFTGPRGVGAAPAINGAVPGGDAVVADYLVERLLAGGSRPALVALEISPETLARPAPWVSDHVIRFFTWRDVAVWAPEILLGDRVTRAITARVAPIHLYRRELLMWLVGRAPPYLRVPPPEQRAAARAPAAPAPPPDDDAPPRARLHPNRPTLSGLRQTRRWLRHYRIDGGETRSLERLLARCRERGMQVVLVGVPVSRWVRELYTPDVERVFRDYVADVSRRYDAEFVDFRTRVPDGLFKDHHHLNVRGATLFAGMLAREVVAPRWAGRQGGPSH